MTRPRLDGLALTLVGLAACTCCSEDRESSLVPAPVSSSEVVDHVVWQVVVDGQTCRLQQGNLDGIGPKRWLPIGDRPPLKMAIQEPRGRLHSLLGEMREMSMGLYTEDAPSCTAAAGCELSGKCSLRVERGVVGLVCTCLAFFGDARSEFTSYSVRSYAVCQDGLRRLELRRDLCGGQESCVSDLTTSLRSTLRPGERKGFDEMIQESPNVMEQFTIEGTFLKFWFGETALTHPRSWSEKGKNVLALDIQSPRHRNVFPPSSLVVELTSQ